MNIKELYKSFLSSKKAKITAGVVAFLLLLIFTFKKDPVPSEIATVRTGTYEQILEEEGITRVKEKFTLYSPVSGILKRIEKHPGEKVKKGEHIVTVLWDFNREVRSPINGSILRLIRESEGPVEMGSPLLEVGDTTQLEIVVEALTQDAVHLHPGDPARITISGGNSFSGKLKLVEPAAYTKVSSLGVEEQRVKVIVDFTPTPEMGEGFQVRCKIISFTKPEATIVPVAALFRDQDDWYVFKVEKGKAHKVKVIIEAKNSSDALVKEGLRTGDSVILFPGESVKEGVKIRNL
ncbi:MAG: efflux RND transporter periplasmic adaptor subunit [Leptospira sp.]|nr:efflux RND transporter periplasmic adaptor subunit [Leptospira sp.]